MKTCQPLDLPEVFVRRRPGGDMRIVDFELELLGIENSLESCSDVCMISTENWMGCWEVCWRVVGKLWEGLDDFD